MALALKYVAWQDVRILMLVNDGYANGTFICNCLDLVHIQTGMLYRYDISALCYSGCLGIIHRIWIVGVIKPADLSSIQKLPSQMMLCTITVHVQY